MTGTYDVRIWAIRVRKGRPKPYQVLESRNSRIR